MQLVILFLSRYSVLRGNIVDILCYLTHWGRVTHVCVSKLSILGSDNGLSPGRRQAIIWIYAGILLIRTWGTNFSENLFEIRILLFKKMGSKVSSAKRRPFCLGLAELRPTKQIFLLFCLRNPRGPICVDSRYIMPQLYRILLKIDDRIKFKE